MSNYENSSPEAPPANTRPVDLAVLPDVFIQMLSGVPSPRPLPADAL